MTDPMMMLRDELRQLAEERADPMLEPIQRGRIVRARPEWRAARELARLTAERDKLIAGLDALVKILEVSKDETAELVIKIVGILRAADPMDPTSIVKTAQAVIDATSETKQ